MDWVWITGKIITATGWTFQTLNEQSACDVVALLEYWREEPPAHVTLALRYLGPSRRVKISEEQARTQIEEIGGTFGKGAVGLPDHIKAMIQDAERFLQNHKIGCA